MNAPDIRFPVRFGLAVIVLFLGAFGGWSVLAPLASAAIAAGEVVVESHRKTIQHLEGGIVEAILVRDGDRVSAGQALLRLDTTQAEAALAQFAGQLDAQRALAARLEAERDGAAAIAFAADLEQRAAADSELRRTLDGQRGILAARRTMLGGQRDILRQRIGQLQAQVDGGRVQLAALHRQRQLIADESADAHSLLDRGLMPRTRVLALEREAASLDGRVGETVSKIASTEQAIGETRMSISSLDATHADEVARELRDAEMMIAELRQRVRANADVLARKEIVAPVSGQVVDLRVFTRGGIIEPGQALMDIVPSRDDLWVSARIAPTDVDVVRPGQPAEVMLAAFSQRMVAPIPGRLVTISADRLIDERTGEAYFTARIDLAPEALATVTITPGMPVQAMIVTGRQSLFDYLVSPLRASLRRSLREQ